MLGTQLFDGYVGTDADFNQPRKTFQEHVDFILENIEKADKLLPMDYEPVTSDDKVPAKYDDILNVPEVTSVKDGKMGIYNKVMGENARQLINGLILRAIKARTLLLAASPAFQDPAQNNVTCSPPVPLATVRFAFYRSYLLRQRCRDECLAEWFQSS